MFFAVGIAAAVLYGVVPAALEPVLYVLVALGSIVAMIMGIRRQPVHSRRPWWGIVAGCTIFVLAAVVRGMLPGGYGSGLAALISDALAVPGYLLLVYAFTSMLRRRRAGRDDSAFADALLFGIAAGLSVWAFLIAPRIGVVPDLADAVRAFFPMVDVLLLVVVAHLMLAGGIRAPSLWLFGGACGAMFVGDLLYAFQWATQDAGSLLLKLFGLLMICAYVMVATAALHPTAHTLAEPQRFVAHKIGVVRTLAIAAVVVVPTIIGYLSPPPNTWNLIVRIALTILLTVTIIGRIVRAHGERVRAEQAERHRATHDPLTDLPNKELLATTITDWCNQANSAGKRISLLFIDLDRFKRVNDSWGHPVGDELLGAVAGRLSTIVRDEDLVCRIGGDEFVIAMASDRPSALAESMARRLIDAFGESFQLSVGGVIITASIGIAESVGATDALDLIRDADTAMYKAKGLGGNKYAPYDSSLRDQVRNKLELEQALRGAQERGELSVHYQPIVDLQTDQLIGFEALMRWNHPKLGMVSPMQFIPIAEETGLIDTSGAWLLEEAAAQLVRWTAERPPDMPKLHMSVNLAVRQLRDPGLVDMVKGVLQRTGLPAAELWLEITESGAMQDIELSFASLRDLRDLGITLCIDDFGTGYSSLSHLSQIPARIVKIDRSFINRIGISNETEAIIRSVVAMSVALDRTVVAEGIETVEQRDWLRALGCEYAQGYFYGPPRAAAAQGDWLRQQGAGPTFWAHSELAAADSGAGRRRS